MSTTVSAVFANGKAEKGKQSSANDNLESDQCLFTFDGSHRQAGDQSYAALLCLLPRLSRIPHTNIFVASSFHCGLLLVYGGRAFDLA